METERRVLKISDLSEADLDTSKLDEAWENIERTSISPAMAKMIGYLSAHWSLLDTTLLLTIIALFELPHHSVLLLVAESSFLQRLSIITSSISASRNQEIFDEWCEIEKTLDALRNKRNDVVHGWWTTNDSDHFLTRLTSRRKLQINRSKTESKDIQKLNVYTIRMIKRLENFLEKIEAAKLGKAIASPSGPPLDRTQSPRAQAQDQARDLKKASRQSRQGPKMSSAQKRAAREKEETKVVDT